MSAPISHIVLANKVYDNYFDKEDKKNFFIGTCLPDIRHFGVIKKEKTHFQNVLLSELKTASPFVAGLKFHSVIDKVRKQFIVTSGIYDLYPESKYKTTWVEFLEEIIFYDLIGNWKKFVVYFDEILHEEKELGIAEADIKQWHHVLQKYFSNKPSKKTARDLVASPDLKKTLFDEWEENIEKIKDNKKILKIFNDLYQNIDILVAEYFKVR